MATAERGTAPKPFVFVIMPFDKAFDDIYEFGIKGAAADASAYAERTSEQMFDDSILDRVVNQISKADVIVADMTGRNPNVYYEVGYAHALDKVTILITQSTKDIPFLAPRLAWGIEESRRRSRGGGSGRFRLDVVIQGTRVPDALEGAEPPVFSGGGYTELQCEIVNQALETSPAVSHCAVETISVVFEYSGSDPVVTARLRLFLPDGPRDFPFQLRWP